LVTWDRNCKWHFRYFIWISSAREIWFKFSIRQMSCFYSK